MNSPTSCTHFSNHVGARQVMYLNGTRTQSDGNKISLVGAQATGGPLSILHGKCWNCSKVSLIVEKQQMLTYLLRSSWLQHCWRSVETHFFLFCNRGKLCMFSCTISSINNRFMPVVAGQSSPTMLPKGNEIVRTRRPVAPRNRAPTQLIVSKSRWCCGCCFALFSMWKKPIFYSLVMWRRWERTWWERIRPFFISSKRQWKKTLSWNVSTNPDEGGPYPANSKEWLWQERPDQGDMLYHAVTWVTNLLTACLVAFHAALMSHQKNNQQWWKRQLPCLTYIIIMNVF